MELKRVHGISSLRKIFLLKMFFCFALIFSLASDVKAADWRDNLSTVDGVDIGDGTEDVDADLYQLGEDFYGIKRFHDPDDEDNEIGGWNNFNGSARTGEEGTVGDQGTLRQQTFQYYTEVHAEDGTVVRLLYNMGDPGMTGNIYATNPNDDKLVGFSVLKDGVYSEFYTQSLKNNGPLGGGLELEDKWGDATGAALVNNYWVGTPEHDQAVARIATALGVEFKDRDGGVRSLAQKADMLNKWSQFRNDWNNNGLSQIAHNLFPDNTRDDNGMTELDRLYDALQRKAMGLSLKPGQQELLDELVAKSDGAVVKDANGKVLTKTNADANAIINSDSAKAAAAKYRKSANAGSTADNGGQCLYDKFSIDIDNCIEQLLFYILGIFAFLLGLAAALFGAIFNYTVVGMSNLINQIESIGIVWKVFRDFTNILFIFILLYLAISTILGLNEHGVKHTLSKLILVAVLINFSMFFAKVVVDSSNILAISFYQKVNPAGKENEFTNASLGSSRAAADILTPDSGIAGVFMNSLNMQKIYAPGGSDQAQKFAMSPNTGTIFIMGSITMFIVTCLFLAASVIFIRRLSTIVILIMTSSLAFAGTLLHKTEGMAHEWWEKLLREAFYAPIFMAIIWMALIVISDENFLKPASASSNFFFDIGTIVNYIIVINFFLMALVVGEKMGASGASGAMKGYKFLKANLGGRAIQAGLIRPIGRAAYRYYEGKDKNGVSHGRHGRFKQWMEESLTGAKGNFLTAKIREMAASGAKIALGGMVNAKVGAGASQKEDFQAKQHAMQEFMAEIKDDPAKQAQFLMRMNARTKSDLNVKIAFQKLMEDMKPEELAELTTQLDDIELKGKNAAEGSEEKKAANEARLTLDHIDQRLSANQQDSMQRKKEGALPFHRQRFKELAEAGDTEGLRQLVQSLNPTQQAGLSSEQKTDSRIIDLLSSKALVQMEGSTNDEQQERIAETIDRRIRRMQTRGEAQADSSKESRRAILREVMQYKQSIADFKKADGTNKSEAEIAEMYAVVDDDAKVDVMHASAKDAMDYYDKNILKGDGAVAQNGRNLARTYGASQLGSDGENIRKEFDKQIKAGRVEVGETDSPKEKANKAKAAAADAAAKAKEMAEKATKDAAEAIERTTREQFARNQFGG